ncbi:hypothetical protein NEAUS04_0552 [Nematocida ausubeli]|nr:hypothetical protein NEAUS04_0552 [Nematocida ausubeli]
MYLVNSALKYIGVITSDDSDNEEYQKVLTLPKNPKENVDRIGLLHELVLNAKESAVNISSTAHEDNLNIEKPVQETASTENNESVEDMGEEAFYNVIGEIVDGLVNQVTNDIEGCDTKKTDAATETATKTETEGITFYMRRLRLEDVIRPLRKSYNSLKSADDRYTALFMCIQLIIRNSLDIRLWNQTFPIDHKRIISRISYMLLEQLLQKKASIINPAIYKASETREQITDEELSMVVIDAVTAIGKSGLLDEFGAIINKWYKEFISLETINQSAYLLHMLRSHHAMLLNNKVLKKRIHIDLEMLSSKIAETRTKRGQQDSIQKAMEMDLFKPDEKNEYPINKALKVLISNRSKCLDVLNSSNISSSRLFTIHEENLLLALHSQWTVATKKYTMVYKQIDQIVSEMEDLVLTRSDYNYMNKKDISNTYEKRLNRYNEFLALKHDALISNPEYYSVKEYLSSTILDLKKLAKKIPSVTYLCKHMCGFETLAEENSDIYKKSYDHYVSTKYTRDVLAESKQKNKSKKNNEVKPILPEGTENPFVQSTSYTALFADSLLDDTYNADSKNSAGSSSSSKGIKKAKALVLGVTAACMLAAGTVSVASVISS